MKSGTFAETLVPAQIEWNGNEPRSTLHDDIYFMPGCGIEESNFVFLESNRLPERFANLTGTFNILETGFGTGLNFILTCAMFQDKAANGFLNFVSLEKHPLRPGDLRRALESIGTTARFKPWVHRLLERYPPLVPGFHHCYIEQNIRLTLILGEAKEMLPLLQGQFDAFYLDGFAPARNADFWGMEILEPLGRVAKKHATLATFTAAGSVQRNLKQVGFEVEKAQGFGSKREMIHAIFRGPRPEAEQDSVNQGEASGQPSANSESFQRSVRATRRALIVGAGLAGSAVGFALAKRGISVTVVDQNAITYPDEFRGIFHPALAAERTIWHRWTLAAFGYLTGLLCDLDADADLNADVNFCGVFQSAEDTKETLRLARAIQNLPLDLVRPVTAEEASKLCGTTISHNGVFFNRGGVLSPGKLCRLLLEQAKAIVHRGVRIDRLYLDGSKSGWIAEGQELDSRSVFHGEYDVVVLATGPGTPDFKLTQAPFDIVRGQMHYIPENSLPGLRSVICHSGYLTPGTGSTSNSSLAAGSTYSRTDVSTTAHLAGQEEILQKLKTGIPDLKADLDLMPGFVGLRIACQDRMPLIGPVSGKPGLYVSTGHGSRGILSSPLAGEIIAAHVCGDPIPVESDLFDHFAERYARRLASRNNDKRNRN